MKGPRRPSAHRAPARIGRPLVGLLLAGLVHWACPPSQHLRPDGADRIQTPEALLEAMGQARLGALRVTGTVEMRHEGQRVKAHMLFLTRRPASLRFETESFFDQPLSILVSDGRSFSAWDMKEGRFIQGTASAENISRVIPVPMDGPTVTGMLMGDPPLLAQGTRSLTWDADREAYLLEVQSGDERQRIWVADAPLRTVAVRLDRAGKAVYTLDLEDWIRKAGRAVAPGKILFEMPGQEVRLRIRIGEAEADPTLEDDLFKLEPPKDVLFERWP